MVLRHRNGQHIHACTREEWGIGGSQPNGNYSVHTVTGLVTVTALMTIPALLAPVMLVAEGAVVVPSLDDALLESQFLDGGDTVWILGGGDAFRRSDRDQVPAVCGARGGHPIAAGRLLP